MLTASSFYAILAYERFHRNTLLLDSRGKPVLKIQQYSSQDMIQLMRVFIHQIHYRICKSKKVETT